MSSSLDSSPFSCDSGSSAYRYAFILSYINFTFLSSYKAQQTLHVKAIFDVPDVDDNCDQSPVPYEDPFDQLESPESPSPDDDATIQTKMTTKVMMMTKMMNITYPAMKVIRKIFLTLQYLPPLLQMAKKCPHSNKLPSC